MHLVVFFYIIPRGSYIWRVLILAIWRLLTIWLPISFPAKMVMYIVTQVIKINVTIETQGMREPPALACRKTMAGNVDVYTGSCRL